MPEGGGGFWFALARACAAAAPLFVLLYYTDKEFRSSVDGAVRGVERYLYRVRVQRWYSRVWAPLEGWERELWEQKHGPPPVR